MEGLGEQNELLRVRNVALEAQVAVIPALTAKLADAEREVAVIPELTAKLADAEREIAAQVTVIPELMAQLDAAQRELAELKRKLTGRTTERSKPRPRKDSPRSKNDARAQAKRKKRREQREALPEQRVTHALPDHVKRSCPDCGTPSMHPLPPTDSIEYGWEPGRLVRRVHQRERALCTVCEGFARAPAPPRVVDGGLYGPDFIARVVVQKVLDCLPLYRQSKMLDREGLYVARSTLTDLFHLAGTLVEPLVERMLQLVPQSRVVYADETSLKMQKVKKLGHIWTFATDLYITYVFSPNRAGKVAVDVLGNSTGVLVVDGYTGYNKVTVPGRRIRAGCNAHARRKFREVEHPVAEQIVELYKEVFAVEREAKEAGIVGTPAHLEMREARAGPAMHAIKALCDEEHGRHGPKTPMGQGLRYLRNQWEPLTRFLEDIGIEPSNNLSERLLRIVALGRKNYLFVGHEDAGRNTAMLASIVQTCVLHDVDPQRYLADVLIRVQAHPMSAIDDLLPHRWKELYGEATAT